jgi:uncharacterized protein (TIGR00251 family)
LSELSFLRRHGDGMMLNVRLTPKASRDEVTGLTKFGGEAVLTARVRAAPESGRANQALERLIADWVGVPPSLVSVERGGKSRLKQVKVEGEPDQLMRLIAEKLAAL